MTTPPDSGSLSRTAAYAERLRAEGSANATEASVIELARALGIPEPERRRLIENVGVVKAWRVLLGTAEAQTRYLQTRVELSDAIGADPALVAMIAGQPRRPGTPETAIAYPEGTDLSDLGAKLAHLQFPTGDRR